MLGIFVGFPIAARNVGGGLAGKIGNMIGAFLAILLLFLIAKGLWRVLRIWSAL